MPPELAPDLPGGVHGGVHVSISATLLHQCYQVAQRMPGEWPCQVGRCGGSLAIDVVPVNCACAGTHQGQHYRSGDADCSGVDVPRRDAYDVPCHQLEVDRLEVSADVEDSDPMRVGL